MAERCQGTYGGALQSRAHPNGGGLCVENLAFFLDVDGTLIELAPTPEAVVVDDELLKLLRALILRSGGAVALISGRAIGVLDDLFQPLVLPCAGLHGFERRSAVGAYKRLSLPPGQLLNEAREELERLVAAHPRLLLEDKRFSIALHFRRVPELEALVCGRVTDLVRRLGSCFELQRGCCVVEIRPVQATKAAAVAEFMQEEPFLGRRPLCLGDDITDESAFEWANAAGGLSIGVGINRESHARAHLPSVAAARLWLRRMVHEAKHPVAAAGAR